MEVPRHRRGSSFNVDSTRRQVRAPGYFQLAVVPLDVGIKGTFVRLGGNRSCACVLPLCEHLIGK